MGRFSQEWLEDYDASEKEAEKIFLQTVIDDKIPVGYQYPPASRFPKLQQLISELFKYNVWAQLPLYGSSFLFVRPGDAKFLQGYNHLEVGDIEKLVDLCKETGRIQFNLTGYPLDYLNCNHLLQTLNEEWLRPPFILSSVRDTPRT